MESIEEWARKWLEDQRYEGKTCLGIKMRGTKYYVYHSTNRYDKESTGNWTSMRSRRKNSKPFFLFQS